VPRPLVGVQGGEAVDDGLSLGPAEGSYSRLAGERVVLAA
jgi:hypothetical protein